MICCRAVEAHPSDASRFRDPQAGDGDEHGRAWPFAESNFSNSSATSRWSASRAAIASVMAKIAGIEAGAIIAALALVGFVALWHIYPALRRGVIGAAARRSAAE